MAPRVDLVQSDTDLPHRTSVVVIGGGIAGIATALFLAQKGIPVVVCEKGQVAAEQSSRNWGWTRVMGRDEREIPLGMESLRIWRGMDKLVEAQTGFTQCGIAYLCETDRAVAGYEAWLEKARPYQVDSRMIGADEIAVLFPTLAAPVKGALYTPGVGSSADQERQRRSMLKPSARACAKSLRPRSLASAAHWPLPASTPQIGGSWKPFKLSGQLPPA